MQESNEAVGQIRAGSLHRNNCLDAGQDVVSAVTVTIPRRSSKLIITGLYIHVPEGHVGLLWSRSGLSVKHQIEVGAGCIDSGYHGEVKVHLYNHSDNDYEVKVGDRIAQLLTLPVNLNNYVQVDEFTEPSERGDKGFGSSDKPIPEQLKQQ